MHQTGLLAQFQHVDIEESDDEAEGLNPEAMEQSPEDAGYSPPLATATEEGESLSQLFEYTLPDWAIPKRPKTINHPIEEEGRMSENGV
jgi:hypothetical protein